MEIRAPNLANKGVVIGFMAGDILEMLSVMAKKIRPCPISYFRRHLRPVPRYNWLVLADTAGQWHAVSPVMAIIPGQCLPPVGCYGRYRRPVPRSTWLLWLSPQASASL